MNRVIVEESSKNISTIDVFSKLIQDRIIFIDSAIDDELANGVIAQMLCLDSINHEEIKIYINSPGGSVYDGLAIYDVAKLIKSPITTVCVGKAFSMGSILMLMGDKRYATKHSYFMLHQPASIAEGSAKEIQIGSDQIQKLKKELYQIISENTSIENPEELFQWDKWIDAEEALNYGIITKVL